MNGPDFQYDGLTAFAPITRAATPDKKGLMSAADKAKLDAQGVGYVTSARIFANQSTTSTTPVDVTGLSATVTVGSRPLKITVFTEGMLNSGADLRSILQLVDVTGAVTIQQAIVASPNNQQQSCCLVCYAAPPSGTRTYKVQMYTILGGATATIYASNTAPATLLIEEI